MPTTGIDTARLAMVIHDLRNVLNAMAMTQYCIESAVPEGDTVLRDDVARISEGIGQFRVMLDVLSIYGHNVLDTEKPFAHQRFDPAMLVRETVQEAKLRSPDRKLTIEQQPGTPREVEASMELAQLALKFGLQNAIATLVATNEVRIQISGSSEVWRTRFLTPEPPFQVISVETVDPSDVHRLVGNARERRGMDLAIVAAMCQRGGGACRIESEPSEWSALVLEWPVRPCA